MFVIWVVIILLAIAVAVLSIRLFLIRVDLRNFKHDLESFDGDGFKKNLSLVSGCRSVEELALAINGKTRELKEAVSHYRRMEDELRLSIANMSHDLRTPLTSIVGYLQLLKNETHTSEAAQYMEVVERRAKTLETLINDFFEISMIEAPQYPIVIEVLDLKALLAQQLADFYGSFKTRGIRMEVDIPDNPVRALGDKKAIDRILSNLLGNALKHSLGEVRIRLYEGKNAACLEISNSAEELSEEDVKRIFDRFYMADKVRNGQGNGLGLSIVKTLLDKIGGTITACYEDDHFTVRVMLGQTPGRE